MKTKINIISLGCDKNTVDSENVLGRLLKSDYQITVNEEEADLIIINTCCFIKDALQESIDTILELVLLKEKNADIKILVAGCMPQRYKDELFEEIPEIDGIIGTYQFENIVDIVQKVLAGEKVSETDDKDVLEINEDKSRQMSFSNHYAYLKIAEGCNNRCTYCIIPSIRGNYVSRKIEDIIEEAKYLAENSVKEIFLIAQNTGYYGKDIYGEYRLVELIKEIAKIDGIEWIKLMYSYPENVTDELIELFKSEKKLCKYIDMPLQHINDNILKKMARKSSEKSIREIISKFRKEVPQMAIRSTFIVGFPSENDKEFESLYEFVKEVKLDRLGVFTYSREEGTKAYDFENQIDEKTKEIRKEQIMFLQAEISLEKNKQMIAQVLDVIIDGKSEEENVFIARTYKDIVDVDGLVFVYSDRELIRGEFVKVKITKAIDYDLIGELI